MNYINPEKIDGYMRIQGRTGINNYLHGKPRWEELSPDQRVGRRLALTSRRLLDLAYPTLDRAIEQDHIEGDRRNVGNRRVVSALSRSAAFLYDMGSLVPLVPLVGKINELVTMADPGNTGKPQGEAMLFGLGYVFLKAVYNVIGHGTAQLLQAEQNGWNS